MIKSAETSAGTSSSGSENPGRVVAFYLPQYHPIPENDRWWGPGFTEWTNAAKARRLFHGHYQPHVPRDLGFYDLRVRETRQAQAELARHHGVEAFCYYHYWFGGKRLLERPFEDVLATGQPEFPFCLCWANATWTGVWHGDPGRILVEQTYPGIEDYRAHFAVLVRAFEDSRYLRVDGKPLFIIYKPRNLPDSRRVVETFRDLAARAGFKGLYLVGVSHNDAWEPEPEGFDAVVVQNLPGLSRQIPWKYPLRKILSRLRRDRITILDYHSLLDSFVPAVTGHPAFHPCVIPNWDNTPRSGLNGLVLENSSPELFGEAMRRALHRVAAKPPEHRLVFVKSWNEWAEGNHLEPDLRFGNAYLEALNGALAAQRAAIARRTAPDARWPEGAGQVGSPGFTHAPSDPQG